MTDIHRGDTPWVQPPGAAHDLDELSTVQLVERLTDQVTGLVRTEMTHALTEVKDKGTRFGIGAGVSGGGVLLLPYGFGALVATAILGLATALDLWLAALIVAAVLIVVGSVVAAAGARRAKNALPPVHARTANSVCADVDTVKEGLR